MRLAYKIVTYRGYYDVGFSFRHYQLEFQSPSTILTASQGFLSLSTQLSSLTSQHPLVGLTSLPLRVWRYGVLVSIERDLPESSTSHLSQESRPSNIKDLGSVLVTVSFIW